MDLGRIRMGPGRVVRISVKGPDGARPDSAYANVLLDDGPNLYPPVLAPAVYKDGVLHVERAPTGVLSILVLVADAAPTSVRVPAAGDFETAVTLSAGVSATLRIDPPVEGVVWLLDGATGRLLRPWKAPPSGTMVLENLPPRPLEILLDDGTSAEFHPREGQENSVTLRPSAKK